jgi:hypothetical protein
MMVTNHYKHFDSLLARYDHRRQSRRCSEEFDTSGETILLVRPIRLANIILIFSRNIQRPNSDTDPPRTQDYDWPVDNADSVLTAWFGMLHPSFRLVEGQTSPRQSDFEQIDHRKLRRTWTSEYWLEMHGTIYAAYTGNYQQILEGLASFFHSSDVRNFHVYSKYLCWCRVHSVLTFHGSKVFDRRDGSPWKLTSL